MQMTSMLFTQGLGLNLHAVFTEVPVTSIHIFNIIAIVVLVPLFDRLIYPALRRFKIRFGMLKRIGVGSSLECSFRMTFLQYKLDFKN